VLGETLASWLAWLNHQPAGTQAVVVGVLLLAVPALLGVIPWLLRRRAASSQYTRWTDIGAQFYRIAEHDNEAPLPTEKRKVTVLQCGDELRFVEGTKSYLAAQTKSLSRTAGRLLRQSKVPHRRYWRWVRPEQRWVDFVVETLPLIDADMARQALRNRGGPKDRYLHFDVFPFASYVVCQHCASFEAIPKS
jgi:hypothetical protein